MESTYGERTHPVDPRKQLAEIVNKTLDRGGIVLIPSFAVGRTQSMLLHLDGILTERGEPRPPVYVNSPMAHSATDIYRAHPADHRLSPEECERVLGGARMVGSVEESKALNNSRGPMVVIAASGMLTGGRVLHHIKAYGPDERNTIILPGYQAAGTRGDRLVRGARTLRIHGQDIPINADVVQVDGFSAHADKNELAEWLGDAEGEPGQVVLVHGEPTAADNLRLELREKLGWRVHVGDDAEIIEV
jgi:metallo-beta-lactamase family protein